MDAREKWVKAAETLADQMSFSDSCSLLYSGAKGVNYEAEFMTKRAELFAHLRTTPEGFALVPVPEWVPVGERLPVVPEVESMINVWYAYKDFVGSCPISRDGAWSLPSHATHWQHNYEPAPPKSESL